jgi:hypothetical protein
MRPATMERTSVIAALAIVATSCTRNEPPAAPTLTITPIALAEPAPVPAPVSATEPEPASDPDPVPALPFPRGVRSVRFLENTVLRAAPSDDAAEVGIIGKDARAAIVAALPGSGSCATRWIGIAPRGWACEDRLAASPEEPTQARAPIALDAPAADGEVIVRGIYGMVRKGEVLAYDSADDALAGENGRVLAGNNSVRRGALVTLDGKKFWKTKAGLIAATSISRYSPSKFHGVALADGDPMPAWVRSHRQPKEPVELRSTPSPRGRVIGELAARTVVAIHETSADGRFVRITDTGWIARADLRAATLTAPPPGAADDERWFDVDADEQVLVAYEGARPVYATLVSTGGRKHATPATLTRVAAKLERRTMASDGAEGGDVYSVADVPWTMYYNLDFALHTAYWHDSFGKPRSHGCINLAPADARALYYWSSPDVPPGWIAVYGDEDVPGSLVRVRTPRVPEPALRGYAKRLHERRLVAAN